MPLLGHLPKLKVSLGLAFGAYFLHDFSMIFLQDSINRQSFNVIPLSFPRYELKCVNKFLFRQLVMLQTIRFMLDQPLKQWLTGRKRGEDGNTKI